VSLGQALGQAFLGRAGPWRLAGHALLWGALATGAVAGAILHAAVGPMALMVPAVLVAGLAIISVVATPKAGNPARRGPPPAVSGQDHPTVWPYY
jgi:uncharacterized membrane protein YoaK (UPF0700 family)